jgi:hypothetical protein
MREIINISVSDVMPNRSIILKAQGMISESGLQSRILTAADDACRLFEELAQPVGKALEISKTDFGPIYFGQGQNQAPGPIEEVYQQADSLVLFAVTIGHRICKRISELFEAHEYLMGSLLDTAASAGTDRASRVIEAWFKNKLSKDGRIKKNDDVLAYSPGYCGWHISAQKKLFDALKPAEIGISLRESFLMEPLKSISGVLIAGASEIHLFDSTFEFCGDCASPSCHERQEELKRK